MSTSGTIGNTVFNTRKVIDNAFRRCRLPAQAITPEMQDYAADALYLLLSDLSNPRTPSWCIEKQIYSLYQGQPVVSLDIGTVDVLNANLRTLQEVTGSVVSLPNSYTVDFSGQTSGPVNSVGIKWVSAAAPLIFETSNDNLTWTAVGTQSATANAGQWTWTDISPALVSNYFRFTSAGVIAASEVYLGTMPQEIPMGLLNRDSYVAQSNQAFEGRPLTYWFQRSITHPKLNLWPAPNLAAEHQQVVVWRHRHIMDVGTLQQDIEVPQRWMDAIIAGLACRVAMETPAVDLQLIPTLDAKAAMALQKAWEGDSDGSPTQINPGIGCYTK
jgi:hypothetical protein